MNAFRPPEKLVSVYDDSRFGRRVSLFAFVPLWFGSDGERKWFFDDSAAHGQQRLVYQARILLADT